MISCLVVIVFERVKLNWGLTFYDSQFGFKRYNL